MLDMLSFIKKGIEQRIEESFTKEQVDNCVREMEEHMKRYDSSTENYGRNQALSYGADVYSKAAVISKIYGNTEKKEERVRKAVGMYLKGIRENENFENNYIGMLRIAWEFDEMEDITEKVKNHILRKPDKYKTAVENPKIKGEETHRLAAKLYEILGERDLHSHHLDCALEMQQSIKLLS